MLSFLGLVGIANAVASNNMCSPEQSNNLLNGVKDFNAHLYEYSRFGELSFNPMQYEQTADLVMQSYNTLIAHQRNLNEIIDTCIPDVSVKLTSAVTHTILLYIDRVIPMSKIGRAIEQAKFGTKQTPYEVPQIMNAYGEINESQPQHHESVDLEQYLSQSLNQIATAKYNNSIRSELNNSSFKIQPDVNDYWDNHEKTKNDAKSISTTKLLALKYMSINSLIEDLEKLTIVKPYCTRFSQNIQMYAEDAFSGFNDVNSAFAPTATNIAPQYTGLQRPCIKCSDNRKFSQETKSPPTHHHGLFGDAVSTTKGLLNGSLHFVGRIFHLGKKDSDSSLLAAMKQVTQIYYGD